ALLVEAPQRAPLGLRDVGQLVAQRPPEAVALAEVVAAVGRQVAARDEVDLAVVEEDVGRVELPRIARALPVADRRARAAAELRSPAGGVPLLVADHRE